MPGLDCPKRRVAFPSWTTGLDRGQRRGRKRVGPLLSRAYCTERLEPGLAAPEAPAVRWPECCSSGVQQRRVGYLVTVSTMKGTKAFLLRLEGRHHHLAHQHIGAGRGNTAGPLMADAQNWARDKADFVVHARDPNNASSNSSRSPLAAEFAALTRALLDASTVADVLEQVVHATRRLVPGADLVSITLRSPDGVFHTPVETEPLATELDHVQYRTWEGPCVEATRASGPGYVRSDDLANEPAWPTFGPVAAGYGYTAVLSTTLLPDIRLPRLSGSLNIYTQRPGVLHDQAAETALLLATHASLALAGTQAVVLGQLRDAQLHQALASRDVIGQAKGILMHRRGISADEAFDQLRRTSQDMNVKLADLAATLATRHAELD